MEVAAAAAVQNGIAQTKLEADQLFAPRIQQLTNESKEAARFEYERKFAELQADAAKALSKRRIDTGKNDDQMAAHRMRMAEGMTKETRVRIVAERKLQHAEAEIAKIRKARKHDLEEIADKEAELLDLSKKLDDGNEALIRVDQNWEFKVIDYKQKSGGGGPEDPDDPGDQDGEEEEEEEEEEYEHDEYDPNEDYEEYPEEGCEDEETVVEEVPEVEPVAAAKPTAKVDTAKTLREKQYQELKKDVDGAICGLIDTSSEGKTSQSDKDSGAGKTVYDDTTSSTSNPMQIPRSATSKLSCTLGMGNLNAIWLPHARVSQARPAIRRRRLD